MEAHVANTGSAAIRPGLSVRIVTDMDVAKEQVSVKTSVVHDVKGESIVLAQPEPPILKSMLHKDVLVTYLVKEGEEMKRNGFSARVEDFVDYNLASGRTTKAVLVTVAGEVKPCNIRMFYRVSPTGSSGLAMKVYGKPLNVLDISLGGAKVSHDRCLRLDPRSVVEVSVEMNRRSYTLEARVLRTWDGTGEGFGSHLQFSSMEFVNMDKHVEHALSQKIFNIEREQLAKERE
jgi:hypothetical protein